MLLLRIIILTTSLSLFGQTEDWKSYSKEDYTIKYPKDWELDESGQLGTNFILLSPTSSEQDQFRENVNLLIQDLTGYNLNLDKFVEISEDQIKKMITDGKILNSKRIKDKGLNYQKVIFLGKPENINLKFEQYYWVVENKAFVLTLTCEENQFDNYKTMGEKILNSFNFNEN